MKKYSLFFVMLLSVTFIFSQNRYWVTASAATWSSNSWSNTSTGAPDGLGAPTGSETANFTSNFTGNCNVDIAVNINNIRMLAGYTGIIDINGNAFNLNGSSTSRLIDGTLSDSPGTSSLALNTSGTVEFRGATINSKITGTANVIQFNGGIFNGIIDAETNSSGSSGGTGGCTFNANVKLTNSGTGYMLMGNGSPDIFNGDLELVNTSTSRFKIAYNSIGTQLNGNLIVSNTGGGIWFGENGGTTTLAPSKIITKGSGGFNANELRLQNFTQSGATAQNISLTGTSTFYNYDSDWGGDVVFTAPRMYTRGTRYRRTSILTKTGVNNDYSSGGNNFDDDYTMNNSGTGYFVIGNGAIPDIFQGNVLLNNTGTSHIDIGHNSTGNTIAGNLTAINSASGSSSGSIYISHNSSSEISIAGDVTLTNNGSADTNRIYLGDKGKISTVGGNLVATNNTTGSRGEIYLASSDTLNLTGNLTIDNIGTSNDLYVYLANSSTSYASIGGNTSVTNSGTGSISRVYMSHQGDAVFNGNISLSNSSTATNSLCYFNYGSNSSNLYNGNIVLESYGTNCDGIYFGSGNGVGTLASSKTVSLGANGFTDGRLYFRNFTQLGATPQSITTTNNSRFENYNSTWNGNVTFISPRVHTRQTTYNGISYLEKTGANNDYSYGANIYNDAVTFKNSGAGYFIPTNNYGSDHNGDVTYVKTSTGLIYPTHSATSTYAGNINMNSNTSITFGSNSGRVEMDGTTAQSINDLGSSPEPNFRRLRTNNTVNEITLNIPISVQTELDLVAGNVISNATNFISMRDNATVASVSNNAYVDGPILKRGNDLFVFPVGKIGVYRPIQISAPSSTSAEFKAEFFPTDPDLSGYNQALKDPTLNHISNCEYWILNRINTSNAVNVRLTYDSYGTSSCSGVDNQAELAVARWDGTMWKDHGNGAFGGTTANGWVETSGAVTSFSPFTLASTTTNNPLPIELTYFDAVENGTQVDLNWETASEIDNDYFTIERSKDGVNFEPIEKVLGAGNSTQNIAYSTVDKQLYSGVSYYRLKQTDYNGEFTYSDVEVVNFSKSNEIAVYPNPVKDILNITGLNLNDVIRIYGIDGKLVYTGNANTINTENYSYGVYQLVISHTNGTKDIVKFVK